MKNKNRWAALCALLCIAFSAVAESVTATWDFQNGVPSSITSVNFNGKDITGTVASDQEGISLTVLAAEEGTTVKLAYNSSGYAQFNQNSAIRVPVVSTKDVLTVVSYPGQYNYTVGGTAASANTTTYTVTASDVAAGYVEIVATKTAYLYSISIVQEQGEEEEVPAAVSYEDVEATWDFSGNCKEFDTVQGGTTSFTVNGLTLLVDATNGKIRANGNSAALNQGTLLKVPVKSNKDELTVVSYAANYAFYTVGSVDGTNTTTLNYTATSADVAQGYVLISVTANNCYLKSISVKQVSPYQEKALYTTDFTEWPTFDRKKTTDGTHNVTTKYSKEDLTFTLNGVGAEPEGVQSKFPSYTGYLISAKYTGEYSASEPSVVTSKLASITRMVFTQAATGGNRGWKISAKGDGDSDWVALFDKSIATSSGETITVDVNRQNVQLKFENFNLAQNAYMVDLQVFGMVDLSSEPALDHFTANGTVYAAADLFVQDAAGNYVADIELSKSETMVGENNPLEDVEAANGTLGTIVYTAGEAQAVATIPVTDGETTVNYIATFLYKPDFTLTYYDTDGSVVGTQAVEKDAAIGQFAYGEDNVSVADGKKFRGWFVAADGGRKLTTDEVIVADRALYAVATDVEGPSTTATYTYNLADLYFYPEDHEAFSLMGSGKYHDGTHGWQFANGDQLALTVGGPANILLTLCRYGSSATITATAPDGQELAVIETPMAADGDQALIEYTGSEAGQITLTFSGAPYVHNLSIMNMGEAAYARDGQWIVLEEASADNFLKALAVANATNGSASAERIYIFLPNGTYDLGKTCLTSISGKNISIIGESMEGVVIKNAPDVANEGIGTTATLLNSGADLYMQDLTLQNALDYYASGSAGRAVCLQDKGQRTIAKNVRLLSYQDTYYSNADSQFYWETSEIHGTVDFICGGGDVFFKDCLLVGESRSASGKTGEATLTAPYTNASNSFGYVFDGCTIENKAAKFNYGRAWGGVPRLAFLNTTLNQPGEIVATRFTAAGMNVPADKFVEYNTLDADGNVVSPSTNVVKFTKDAATNEMETILSESEAAGYAIGSVFTNWQPAELAALVEAPVATYADGVVSWEPVEGAVAYAIFRNGAFETIVTDGTSYETTLADGDELAISSANSMGGLGEKVPVGPFALTLDEAQGVQPAELQAGVYNVSLKRTVKRNMWNTVCLPFSMTDAQLKEVFGTDARTATVAGFDGATVTFSQSEGIVAYEPCLLFTNTGGTEYQIDGVVVPSFEAQGEDAQVVEQAYGDGLVFFGVLRPYELEAGQYFVYDNNLWRSDGTDTMKATRAAFAVSGAKAKSLALAFEQGGVATAIEHADTADAPRVAYNLQGQRVDDTYRGIVVSGGKKYMNK